MGGGFAALFAILFELQFIWSIYLIFFGNVILVFANRAKQCKKLTGTFLGHGSII